MVFLVLVLLRRFLGQNPVIKNRRWLIIFSGKFLYWDHPFGLDQSGIAACFADLRLLAVYDVIYRVYVVVCGRMPDSYLAGPGLVGDIVRRGFGVSIFYDLSSGEQWHV